MPEKLLSIKEVAEYLKISEEEVKRLVDSGEIPAYKIGDTFLRFRLEQIEAIEDEIRLVEESEGEAVAKPALDARGHQAHPYTDLERDIKKRTPSARQYDYSSAEKMRDFFYFNDFYILCFVLIILLMFLIFKS